MPRMPRPGSDTNPLDGTDRLLVDGSNLLHALRRGAEPAPAAALIGRLRGAVPATVGIELVLDGLPDRGMHNTRIASGLIVRYSGRRTGDQVLIGMVDEAARAVGGAGGQRRASLDNVLVVTDDHQLRVALRERGVRSAGTRWLIGRLERERIEGPAIGNRRPPAMTAAQAAATNDGEPERPGWRPGRGATAKRGNPRRGHPPG